MRVLMLNYEFPPLGGGAGNENLYLLKEFSKRKSLWVDLITSSVKGTYQEKFSDRIMIYYLDVGKDVGKLHFQSQKDLLVYSFKALVKARELIRGNSYDLAHAWFGIPCGFVAMLLGLPYLVALQGSDVPFYNQRFKIVDKFVFQHISKLIWIRSQVVIANSHGLKELALQTSLNQHFEVIYNGVDIKEFEPAKTKFFRLRAKLELLCVSRLIPRKGIDYLLQAISLLNKNLQAKIKLRIVGDGPQLISLQQLVFTLGISNQVSFVGRVEHRKIAKLYQQADIFILPSLNEGMSNTLLEAISSGLPVITTNTGGTKELVKNNGIVVPFQDSWSIADAVYRLSQNFKLLSKMGKESRKLARQMSWNRMAEAYVEVYRKSFTNNCKS